MSKGATATQSLMKLANTESFSFMAAIGLAQRQHSWILRTSHAAHHVLATFCKAFLRLKKVQKNHTRFQGGSILTLLLSEKQFFFGDGNGQHMELTKRTKSYEFTFHKGRLRNFLVT